MAQLLPMHLQPGMWKAGKGGNMKTVLSAQCCRLLPSILTHYESTDARRLDQCCPSSPGIEGYSDGVRVASRWRSTTFWSQKKGTDPLTCCCVPAASTTPDQPCRSASLRRVQTIKTYGRNQLDLKPCSHVPSITLPAAACLLPARRLMSPAGPPA